MGEGQTVHLADDDEDDRMLIKDALQEANPNLTVIEAENGKELIENVKESGDLSETVVLLDMNMPKMNGIEAIQEIRAEPGLSELPAVMMSTSSNPELKKKALAAGANDFIVKPNTFKALLDVAKSILSRFLGKK
ncbi:MULTISPECIES: response regulator [Dyadobacter]|jgi:CheY-like chemotaxis protein|uniref:Response regulator n=1 Tax=Dyadobacter chenhuakuii TaxID=2909339 RepID=A0A9X1QBY0_9BACT|nr:MULTISPECIES: response regulator [Dyadobacter]MCE7070655.1 response regulator [Dyadobacter sp. CY327]MCF2495143.1 response regulator [Dyadobacter chenhuakuii]MCF2498224.1 response regulator [Dyadobacter chenhuakuii]MCF2518694.1 response regulator [Dyadobacter sp. CY351]USJ31546.1 response regulator [Dyadobacter chenhuakuii]